ncbi:YflT domain-containing protein [Nesterenkonia halophila]|uniref:general stress protein n=1 Tax=Nesterenkonia halophila TaxID=302044 RepID=UPI001291E5CC|nr:general stress protein [Nesterenkonia halophila]
MAMNASMTPQQAGGLPRGELLGRYRTYEEAQQVVDHLAASEGFDVKMLTIVGNDLRSVEHIRSRLSYPRVAGAGAAQGAMFGAFIGFLMYLFGPQANPLDILFAVLLGSAVWMIVGVIGYAVRRGRRDFASSSQLVATSFDVVCSFDAAGHARRLMQGVGVSSMQPAPGPQAPVQQPAPGPQQPVPGQPGAQSGPDRGQPEGAPAAQAAEPRAGYGDLPDGRPRYGVRTTSASSASSATSAAPAAEQQEPGTQTSEQQTSEQTPSESAEPSAPQDVEQPVTRDASSQQDVPTQQPASSQQASPQDGESSEETTR